MLIRRNRLTARIRSLIVLCTAWLSMVSTTWAQVLEEEPTEKSYVVSYMIIVFAVSFGLMVICRGGKRTVSFRRDD